MKGEEASDLMVDAIKYGFTNRTALLIGGLLFGVYVMLYLLITIVPFILWYYGREIWAIVTLAVLAIPSLILTLFVAGYIVRCMRLVIRGNDVLPSPLEHIVGTLKLGFMGLLIYLPYIVIMMLPLLALLVVSRTALLTPDNIFVVLLFMAVLMTVSVALAIFGFIFILLVVNYAATDNFFESLNPITAFRLLLKNPLDFLISVVIYYLVTVVFSIAAVTVVLYPWAFFLTVTALCFILAKYYRRVTAPAAGA